MPGPSRNSRITLRQYLAFGGLERGWSQTRIEAFIEDFGQKRPHLDLSAKNSYDEWDRKRKEGVLR